MSEQHLCPDRQNTPRISGWPEKDTWDVRANGDRCCSFCGSLHPEDYMRLMRDACDDTSETHIERATGKTYKFYVHQKDVSNALDGGIKFYVWHISSDAWADEANALWPTVMSQSRKKQDAHFAKLFPGVRE